MNKRTAMTYQKEYYSTTNVPYPFCLIPKELNSEVISLMNKTQQAYNTKVMAS